MDLAEIIDVSIESLQDPESKVFDFDKEVELLFELKKVLNKNLNDQNVIGNYKKQIEELNKITSVLRGERSEFEEKYEDNRRELDKFSTLVKNEISGKMRVLGYLEKEIEQVSEMNKFSEICELRERVLREFDMKFKVEYVVKDTPKKELLNYSIFKV